MRFIPGHGDVADQKDVAEFGDYLTKLRVFVGEGRKAGLKDDALTQYVKPKLLPLFPDWRISERALAAEVGYMNDELAGAKKRPVPQPE